jgi:hypothetical protein
VDLFGEDDGLEFDTKSMDGAFPVRDDAFGVVSYV